MPFLHVFTITILLGGLLYIHMFIVPSVMVGLYILYVFKYLYMQVSVSSWGYLYQIIHF